MIMPNCRLVSLFQARVRQARRSYGVQLFRALNVIFDLGYFQFMSLLGHNPIVTQGRSVILISVTTDVSLLDIS